MKYIAQYSFKARTKAGEVTVEPGQVVTLPTDKALKLLNEVKISPVERSAYKVYSELLQAHLWVVYGPEDISVMRAKGTTEAIYTGQEIAELKKLPKKALKTIHEAKEVFPLASIEEIINEDER